MNEWCISYNFLSVFYFYFFLFFVCRIRIILKIVLKVFSLLLFIHLKRKIIYFSMNTVIKPNNREPFFPYHFKLGKNNKVYFNFYNYFPFYFLCFFIIFIFYLVRLYLWIMTSHRGKNTWWSAYPPIFGPVSYVVQTGVGPGRY